MIFNENPYLRNYLFLLRNILIYFKFSFKVNNFFHLIFNIKYLFQILFVHYHLIFCFKVFGSNDFKIIAKYIILIIISQ